MATTLPPPTQQAPPTAPPRLADGVELIGLFEDSGFKDPPYIARRADGQVVQMKPMLFALAEEIDGRRSYEEVGVALSHRLERGVTGEMAEMLIEEQLRPLGIVAAKDGEQHELKKVDPLLALKFRASVLPDRMVRALTTVFKPLFLPPVMALAVAAFVGLDVWLFFVHGISQSLRHTLYNPALLLALLGGVVIATAFHEIGHATALRYGGGKPGVMGVGIYIVWPAFYTDITDSYRLGKWGRLRTDTGGMYFNAIFALAVGGAYALTGFEPLLLLVVLQTFAIVQQSLPFLRLDGYYIISDLTGVPDILLRIKSVLTSLLPWRKADDRVTELKPWVRFVVTAYVVLLVPVLALMFTLMVINAPRLFATGWDSFWTHYDAVGPAFSKDQALRGVREAVQMVVLALPAIGFAYTAARIAARGGTGAWKWSAGSPVRRAGVTLAGAAAVGAIAFTWWPNGDYRPIQPGERGTLTGGFQQLSNVTSGRAALTPERQRQLHGAPAKRQATKPSSSARKKQSKAQSTQGHLSSKPQQPATNGSDQTSAEPQTTTTPESVSSQPDPAGQDPSPTQDPSTQDPATDPSASSTPPPDQTTTQPQDGGAQMTPQPTSP
ncbi:MAG: putative peptide zinc metalloprotease protein [Thermoleophilaceae bacterium]|nr:putative peptide zinc metalloprotease protein [Thermoleophilaceae bacterium]